MLIIGWRSPDGDTRRKGRFSNWALTPEETEELRIKQGRGRR